MNTYLKYFLIGIGVVIGVVILVKIMTPKVVLPQEETELVKKLEDLEKNNLELIKKQIEIDSINVSYEERIQELETKIMDVGQSRVIIQKIYSDKIQKSKKSTPSEVDSFFKQRYNY